MRAAARRLLGAVLLVVAIALGLLAFTRFEQATPPQPGSPSYQDFEAHRMAETRISVGLGLVASFTLLGSFALLSTPATGPDREPGPTPKRP